MRTKNFVLSYCGWFEEEENEYENAKSDGKLTDFQIS